MKTACSSCLNKCCSQPYDWVYLTEAEIERLARLSGLEPAKFVTEQRNAETGDVFKILNLPCRFLDAATGLCTVYDSRPLVCRIFPFYPEPLTGYAAFLPAQCGDNLHFVSDGDLGGWSLADFDAETSKWLGDLWREAKLRGSKS